MIIEIPTYVETGYGSEQYEEGAAYINPDHVVRLTPQAGDKSVYLKMSDGSLILCTMALEDCIRKLNARS